MQINVAIKKIIKESKIGQVNLARQLGIGQSTIATVLGKSNINVKSAVNYLNAMGYELVIQPRKSGRRSDGQIVITMTDE